MAASEHLSSFTPTSEWWLAFCRAFTLKNECAGAYFLQRSGGGGGQGYQ